MRLFISAIPPLFYYYGIAKGRKILVAKTVSFYELRQLETNVNPNVPSVSLTENELRDHLTDNARFLTYSQSDGGYTVNLWMHEIPDALLLEAHVRPLKMAALHHDLDFTDMVDYLKILDMSNDLAEHLT